MSSQTPVRLSDGPNCVSLAILIVEIAKTNYRLSCCQRRFRLSDRPRLLIDRAFQDRRWNWKVHDRIRQSPLLRDARQSLDSGLSKLE